MAHNLNGPPRIVLIRRPGPFNLIFGNQFKNAPYNNTYMAPNLNGPPNNNIVTVGPGLCNSMFAKQFKRITRVKLRVFNLKVANGGPLLTFL